LESTDYPEWRKKELRIVEDARLMGVPVSSVNVVNPFCKIESLEGFKDNRIINARCDLAKCAYGPLVKSIEREVYECIPEFVKHQPITNYPSLISEYCTPSPGQTVLATDYTSFEGHFDPKLMRACECQLYHYMSKSLICNQFCDCIAGTNVCKSKICSYTVSGCRMSGDMCTSLGNGFTNLMIIKYLVHKRGGTMSGFVEGDDGIFRITGKVPTSADYAALGFNIKIEKVEDPELASFCGQIYSRTAREIVVDPIYTL